MKYCVIKNTITVIDGSENSKELMLQNATSSGFIESEVEILTEEEYEARKELEPKPIKLPTSEERIEMLEDTIMFLMGGM